MARGDNLKATWLRACRHAKSILAILVSTTLAGCAFENSITPIVWITPDPNPSLGDSRYSTPAPIPSLTIQTPTPMPTVTPFRGFREFDCRGPVGGDDLFGYCRDALSEGNYYVWARCSAICPEWPFPGVAWMKVGDSSNLRDFMQLIDDRDDALAASADALEFGGMFAGLDVVIASLGWETAECIVAGEVTLGTSCIRFGLTVLAATGAALRGISDSKQARAEADGVANEARGNL